MTTTRMNHTGHNHPNTPAARAACRRRQLIDARLNGSLTQALGDSGTLLAARSSAKANEYRHDHGAKGLPHCSRCGSYRYDFRVTAPDVDGMCGPTYCHYSLSN